MFLAQLKWDNALFHPLWVACVKTRPWEHRDFIISEKTTVYG